MTSAITVAGIDWYRRGWVCAVLRSNSSPEVLVDPDLASLLARVADASCIGVDMPIGLPERVRESDRQARKFVGPRWQSVFETPPAAVLAADSYSAANAIAEVAIGKRISQQAWALRDNIAVVADAARHDDRMIEVHPEVSFCALMGAHVPYSKSTWNGLAVRRAALAREGIELADELGEAGVVPPADVLDAAVAAWSAKRYAEGQAVSLPAGATPGQREVIWY